jgi:hypothetical protein
MKNEGRLHHEAERIREELAAKEYRCSLQKPERSFPIGWILIILAAGALFFGKPWIGWGLVAVFTFFAARSDWTLFFRYQLLAVVADVAILIAATYNNDIGIWILHFFVFCHVGMALIYDVVFFLFWE